MKSEFIFLFKLLHKMSLCIGCPWGDEDWSEPNFDSTDVEQTNKISHGFGDEEETDENETIAQSNGETETAENGESNEGTETTENDELELEPSLIDDILSDLESLDNKLKKLEKRTTLPKILKFLKCPWYNNGNIINEEFWYGIFNDKSDDMILNRQIIYNAIKLLCRAIALTGTRRASRKSVSPHVLPYDALKSLIRKCQNESRNHLFIYAIHILSITNYRIYSRITAALMKESSS